ncbi:MAG: lytic murein transglycosylase B [Gammaproteobacteria bacterium]|nr:lytic murein transglycosylase B [Gammaproteobacteria bacterium]
MTKILQQLLVKSVIAWISLTLLLFTPLQLANAAPQQGTRAIELKAVKQFIDQMVNKHQFSRHYLDTLFSQVRLYPPSPRKKSVTTVVPLEKLPWYRYRDRYITPTRVTDGVEFWQAHQKALTRAQKRYHVPANIIVAIIAVESNYGKNKGKYTVIHTLTTLGFSKNRRARYFRKELTQFLLLCREEHLDPLTVKGSYAGAIGQPQFMPSSYRYYAVDFSGDQHRDLINDEDDVIGSIANYFHKNGWKSGQLIAVPAKLKATATNPALHLPKEQFKPSYTQAKIKAYGFVTTQPLPAHAKVRFIRLEQKSRAQYWLGLQNFYVITRYNYSTKYAMAVYQLSQEIAQQYQQMAMKKGKLYG